ncbi:MAG: urea ABC transporter permease subunit UrtB [Cyanobium sp. MAG_137]|nr:urea ABC transporter permease subunit UrtB [Cyanobium sp. MAG_255]MDP4707006.1 urea ABC transporter permease subunit UrtB [Cyanobium sp. MAG_237]MDP4808705.1 urea ABC transporter permease subunit UrtB [Cyanobium sp. MAG_160]MDP4881985.1 urea ABC transporter permease subunit UrtB [Cyanobium sp. MAG_137]MDP4948160.1 urea ABC transporter permease subunit UrtB [Cyanobium sp. MAG_102]
MELLFESLFNGVAIGSVLMVAALGLAIVFGLMGVINLAHGELIMLGAYTTYVVQLIFKLPALQSIYWAYILVAIPLAFVVSGVVGILLERTVIRRLYGNPLETLLATWGVSLILQQFVRSVPLAYAAGFIFALLVGFSFPFLLPKKLLEGPSAKLFKATGWFVSAIAGILLAGGLATQISTISRANSRNVDVTAPRWMRGGIEWMNLTFPVPRLVIIAMTILAVLAVFWFLNRSVWGMRIRAVTQNRSMSDCLGIPTDTVDVLTFGIGSGLAGVAGVAVSLLGSVGPNVGSSYIVGCFMVVVLGGVGNLFGTILASFSIGLLTDLIGAGRLLSLWPNMPSPLAVTVDFFATTSMAQVMIFALIVIFLQFRPGGLFPLKGRTVEA